jgi:hypothetical protein
MAHCSIVLFLPETEVPIGQETCHGHTARDWPNSSPSNQDSVHSWLELSSVLSSSPAHKGQARAS